MKKESLIRYIIIRVRAEKLNFRLCNLIFFPRVFFQLSPSFRHMHEISCFGSDELLRYINDPGRPRS